MASHFASARVSDAVMDARPRPNIIAVAARSGFIVGRNTRQLERADAFVADALEDDANRSAKAARYLESKSKRSLDVLGATSLLLVMLPLLLTVALLIRATSRGPVLFRQTRCGGGGKPFTIFKFRSMYHAGDEAGMVQQASRSDPRVTPIGAFMRRTSIDELPQLLNVLQGHMSLIGPRPHATSHDAYYGDLIPCYAERFQARPGLSGLAQIRGARGATPQVSDMERRILLDLVYIRRASLATDIKLIGGTVREMVFSSSAY